MDKQKFDKLSDEQVGQLYELMRSLKGERDGGEDGEGEGHGAGPGQEGSEKA